MNLPECLKQALRLTINVGGVQAAGCEVFSDQEDQRAKRLSTPWRYTDWLLKGLMQMAPEIRSGQSIVPKSHRADPHTSYEAAQKAAGRAKAVRTVVLLSLNLYGPQTADEMAQRVGMKREDVARRCSELLQDGKIRGARLAPTRVGQSTRLGKRQAVPMRASGILCDAMQQLTVGSLFAGIGGFDLGLERAGMRVIWQSEIDPYACAVLRRHWPAVPNLGDIRGAITAVRPDVISGGFPCQPFSSAARGRNLDGNLWPRMFRVIGSFWPTWVIGENVAHIDGVALRQVETDLESCGYKVRTFEIPACSVGLDHKRRRYWILGHADRDRESSVRLDAKVARVPRADDYTSGVGMAHGISGGLDANRMRCLGNAIVPQIAEIIGRAIIETEQRLTVVPLQTGEKHA